MKKDPEHTFEDSSPSGLKVARDRSTLLEKLYNVAVFIGVVALGGSIVILAGLAASGSLEPGELRQAADVINKLAITIAVLGGGVWTLFTFSALRNRDKARAELAHLELALERQAVLRINVAVEPFRVPGSPGRWVKCLVTIANKGSRNTTLGLKNSLRIAELVPDGLTMVSVRSLLYSPADYAHDDRWEHHNRDTATDGNTKPESDYTLRAGMTIEVLFIASIPGPGAYMAAFSTPLHENELESMRALGMKDVENSVWASECLFTVEPSGEEEEQEGINRGRLDNLIEWFEKALVSIAEVLTANPDLDPPAVQILWDFQVELAGLRRHLLFHHTGAAFELREPIEAFVEEWEEVLRTVAIEPETVFEALAVDLEAGVTTGG